MPLAGRELARLEDPDPCDMLGMMLREFLALTLHGYLYFLEHLPT